VIDRPRYLVVGGEVFDAMAAAPAEQQHRFLTVLRELRRDPLNSEVVTIDKAKDWGVDTAFIADLEGLVVSYHVTDRYVLLIEAIWV
jgi:hypothetical protein